MKKFLIFSLMILTTLVFAQEKKEDKKDDSKSKVIVTSIDMSNIAPLDKDSKKDNSRRDESVTHPKAKGGHSNAKKEGHHSSTTMVHDVALQQSPKEKAKYRKKIKKMPKWLKEDGLLKDRVITWGGFGSYLYGYTDERYAGDDKGAYLKASTLDLGVEYYKSNLGDYAPILKDMRAGFNIAFKKRNAITPKTLNAIDNVPTKTVPDDEKIINAESWLNLGVFIGIDNKWYAIDLGLTVSLNPYYEKERVFSDGSKEEGRGWLWGTDTNIYPNMKLRLGRKDSAHFIFSVLRDDYDLKYGVISIFIDLPISEYFALDVGGYLYQTDSIFIAPKLTINGFTAKLKMGTILNYQNPELKKVAIFDSLFGNLALSYEW